MSKTLKDIGELGLLAALAPILQHHTRDLPLGTGDDVAITPPEPDHRLVWTLDTMIEDTHFRWYPHPLATPERVAGKLVATNVSDLASKGAEPLYALISVGTPSGTTVDRIGRFYAGMDTALEHYGVRLIGGDTVRAPQWVLSLALVGRLDPRAHIASRSNSLPGQCLYITGHPGEAGAGLEILEGRLPLHDPHQSRLVQRTLSPEARLAAGRALAASLNDLAMIDVSDGVATDAGQIARLSRVAITIEESRLPINESLEAARMPGRSPAEHVLFGGDDYELMFTTASSEEEVRRIVREADPGLPVTRIGRVEEGEGVWLETAAGRKPLTASGFQHFTV